MSQSLSKIGVQFIADMSDMVQKMNGMSAFTKNWAEKLATSMFSATPEQKQLKFISDFRQDEINTWNVIGRALENKTTDGEGTIEAVVKLNS